ncbi:MAG: hypothetical protein AAF266_00015 [Planctomycetota bacterium]
MIRSAKKRRNASPDTGKQSGTSPILLRFFGCSDERVGLNGDYFTVGNSAEDDVNLPSSMEEQAGTRMRFSRGAEGWRVTVAEDLPFYLNQSRHQGLTPLRSGDAIRLTPGGSGFQFLVRQQQDASLAKLIARHAPRMAKAPEASSSPARFEQSSTSTDGPQRLSVLSSNAGRFLGVLLLVTLAIAAGYVVGSLRSQPTSPAASIPERAEPSDVE